MPERTVTFNINEFTAKAKRAYERVREELELTHWGDFIVIEPESGDYFLGKTMDEAEEKARAKYPEGLFYFARIGYRAAVVFRRQSTW
ncbi:MAG: hypothetical protein ACE5MB_03045 [Anaerolineae bacterium]